MHLDAFAAQLRELRAVASRKLRLEVMPHVEELERARRHAMRRVVRAHRDIAADAQPLARAHASDLQFRVQLHERAEIVERLFGNVYGASADSLKVPLARIERNADGVIEVRVRDEDVRHGDENVRTASDVERDAELFHAEPCLMSRRGDSFDGEAIGVKREELAHRATSSNRS